MKKCTMDLRRVIEIESQFFFEKVHHRLEFHLARTKSTVIRRRIFMVERAGIGKGRSVQLLAVRVGMSFRSVGNKFSRIEPLSSVVECHRVLN